MKTRKYIESKAKNDYKRILEAQTLLLESIRKQPFCRHTVTVQLSNGETIELFANPRWENVYTA